MPFPTYDRQTLLRFALFSLRNRLEVNPTPGTLWYKVADSWADVLVSLSGHQQHVADQILPETADTETLDRHAFLRGISRKSAGNAEGHVDITLTAE
ncbi:MAG: hypothetical protein GY854_04430 [Deltaproteobacteria bacterium]|nr:hypothetical protein [Deltaproteobacteria bacterium]